MNLSISPHGRLFVETAPDSNEGAAKRIIEAFADSSSRGILHLSTTELQTSLPADFSFARDFGRAYLTQLCHTPEIAGQAEFPTVSPPTEGDLAATVLSAPPMRGLEYLNAELLKEWWADLNILVRKEVQASGHGVQEYLRERNPLWRTVGRTDLPDISAAVKVGSAREAAWEQLNTPVLSTAFTSATKCRSKIGEKSSSSIRTHQATSRLRRQPGRQLHFCVSVWGNQPAVDCDYRIAIFASHRTTAHGHRSQRIVSLRRLRRSYAPSIFRLLFHGRDHHSRG
jgi:hypothetical protein